MFKRRGWSVVVLVLASAACGGRTGLSASGPIRSADCQKPWLLFDLSVDGDPARSGIYAMRADGTEGHAVALPHAPAAFPSVSPDGTKLLYATFMTTDGSDDSALYLYDFASQSSSLVVTTSQLTYSALSPDGQTVAWTTGYSLHAVALDGSNDRTLLAGPNDDGTGYGHPVFAADSTTIVYATGGLIGAIGIDGSNDETLLTAIPGSFQYPNPAFSPDYQQIVVGAFCDQTSPQALRVYAFGSLPGATCASGQLLVEVSPGSAPNQANDPSWGSDGRIAYGSGKDVYVIAAGGGAAVALTAEITGDAGTVTAADPVWAPGCADVPEGLPGPRSSEREASGEARRRWGRRRGSTKARRPGAGTAPTTARGWLVRRRTSPVTPAAMPMPKQASETLASSWALSASLVSPRGWALKLLLAPRAMPPKTPPRTRPTPVTPKSAKAGTLERRVTVMGCWPGRGCTTAAPGASCTGRSRTPPAATSTSITVGAKPSAWTTSRCRPGEALSGAATDCGGPPSTETERRGALGGVTATRICPTTFLESAAMRARASVTESAIFAGGEESEEELVPPDRVRPCGPAGRGTWRSCTWSPAPGGWTRPSCSTRGRGRSCPP